MLKRDEQYLEFKKKSYGINWQFSQKKGSWQQSNRNYINWNANRQYLLGQ